MSLQSFLTRVFLLVTLFVCALQIAQCHIVDIYLEQYLDRCLDGVNHKAKPGPESDLFKQCSPWKDRSCCTEQVAEDLHLKETWYRFNYSHCGQISSQCEKYHRQDLCFYECSPNVGPWLRPQQKTIRNEHFVDVPLCRSHCNLWWNACKDDFTCVENWSEGFKWGKNGNSCPVNATCRTYKEIYGSAEAMCEKIWDGSFKVQSDDQPCMVLWFDGNNPNYKVAEKKVAEITKRSFPGNTAVPLKALVVHILLAVFTCILGINGVL